MKIQVAIQWWKRVINSGRKTKLLQMLQQQTFLLHHGIESTAEIIDAVLYEETAGSLLHVKLSIKLRRPDGTFLFIQTQAMVSLKHIPTKGEWVHIKYLPDDLSGIIIL